MRTSSSRISIKPWANKSAYGLSDYLLYDQPLNDLIVWPGIEKLTIISGSRTIENSTELLGSNRMRELVHEMKSRYDDRYVIFDVPPLLNVADAVAFAPIVDSILMVVEEGRTSNADVKNRPRDDPPGKILGVCDEPEKMKRRLSGRTPRS